MATVFEQQIPNFQAEMDRLQEIGTAGFIMGFGWGLRGMTQVHSTYAAEWREIYERKNYFVGDPVLLWHMTHIGDARWSDIKLPDLRGVLSAAEEFGIRYGAMFSRRTEGQRSFLSVSRPDRELSDAEMAELSAKFSVWVEAVLAKASLTANELAVLKAFRDGLGQRDTAEMLGIAETTVKQRALRACGKLGAASRTQAVAIAVQRQYFDD